MAKKTKESGMNIRRPVNTLTNLDPSMKFRIEESYKAIRANLIFSIIKQGCKKIVFTSSRPSEGKTSVTVNLAVSLASADYKVLLIDCDLRKPKIHQYFGLRVAPGLTNYLGSVVDKAHQVQKDTVIKSTNEPNLFILPAGSCPPNPAELLASEPMSDLLALVEGEYDYILLDTPPINVVSDALPVIKMGDGVVCMIRANSSTYPEVDKMVQSLEFIHANVLGFVLTAKETDTKSKSYYDYGYYSYGPNKNKGRSNAEPQGGQSAQMARTPQPPAGQQKKRPAPAQRPTGGTSPQIRTPQGEMNTPSNAPAMGSGFHAQAANNIPMADSSTSNDIYSGYDISSFDLPPRKQ